MTTLIHQDTDIIYLDYTFREEPDGAYFKLPHYTWMSSVYGDNYPVLMDRDKHLIEIDNEYWQSKYSDIEASLTGDVLILGLGIAILDQFLVTGSSWKWVENNAWLAANIVPVNGTVHEGDASDMDFLATLGTFDTILIDFPLDKRMDWATIGNVGYNVIEMRL